MVRKPKVGEEVAWNTSQGPTRGRVVKKVARPAKIKSEASKNDPRYVVESKSGKRAAHKAGALRPVKKASKRAKASKKNVVNKTTADKG